MRAKEKKTDGIVQTTLKMQTRSVPDYSPCFEPCAAFVDRKLSSWPINLGDVTPIAWWRTMPADHIGEGPQLVLRETLDKICVAKKRQWVSAMRADAAASIAIVIEATPIMQITQEIDLAMSALMSCALDGNAGAVLVLAHVLYRAPLEHPFAQELSISWLTLNLQRARHMQKRPTAMRYKSISLDAANAEPSLHGGMQA